MLLSSNEPVPVASLFITMPWVALLVSRPVTLSAFAASIVSTAPLLISRLWHTAGDAGDEVMSVSDTHLDVYKRQAPCYIRVKLK